MKTSRADLHCHSTASQVSKLGVQRALGLPECATPPEEVYALAKRRGHGLRDDHRSRHDRRGLEIADRPDVFVSEELTARFRGEPQAVHILCYGITPDDHDWLQAHADDVEVVADYLHEQRDHLRAGAPLLRGRGAAAAAPPPPAGAAVRRSGRSATARARASSTTRRRSTSRRTAASASAAATTTRAWTSAARGRRRREASTPREFLAHIRAGRVSAHGEQGSAAKWAHAAMALAIRALGRGDAHRRARPAAVLRMVERVMTRGRRPHRLDRLRPRPRGRPRAAARLAGRGRPAA